MDAVLVEGSARTSVSVVGVLYGERVQIRFPMSGADLVLPARLLELTAQVSADLRAWFAMSGPGWMSEMQFGVLDRLIVAGPAGLLDTQYPWPRKQVETARRVLRHRGLVGPADPRADGDGDGRMVRWRVTNDGVVEHRVARRMVTPIAATEVAAARS